MPDPVTEAAVPLRDDEAPPAPPRGIAGTAAFWVGATGLMAATAADSIAVLGRHTGFALLGAIEVVQAAIVFIAAAAMVSVTLARGHAAVHILTDRLAPARRIALTRAADLVAAVALLLLAVGTLMLLGDLWDGHERSELLHLPLRWLRLLIAAALGFIAWRFLRHAFALGDGGVPDAA